MNSIRILEGLSFGLCSYVTFCDISSKTGETANTAYFTPLSFHHFFTGGILVVHYSPPPIKRGKLFEMDQVKKPKIKFGTHMFTMKYQLIFNPVTISHLYRHSTSDVPKKNSRVAFTGLKGRFDVCEIDLHQRENMSLMKTRN